MSGSSRSDQVYKNPDLTQVVHGIMCIIGHDKSSELNMLNLMLDSDGGSIFPDSPQDSGRIDCTIRLFQLFGA